MYSRTLLRAILLILSCSSCPAFSPRKLSHYLASSFSIGAKQAKIETNGIHGRSGCIFPRFIRNRWSLNSGSDADEEVVGGFGVGEKTLELKHLVDSDEDIDIGPLAKVDGILSNNNLTASDAKTLSSNATSSAKASPTLNFKAVLRFLAPTLALWIAPPVMSLIDTSVVGRYCGPTDLAALSPGCTLIDSSSYLFMFIATAATNMVARARANQDYKSADRILSEALFLSLCSGIFLAALVFLAGRPLLLAIAGQESAMVVPSALKYATVRAFAQPAVVMASVARAAALASKDTKGPLISVAIAFVLNAVGTVGLVRITNLGIVGAGIGTLVADVSATIFLLSRITRGRRREQKGNIEDSEQHVGLDETASDHLPSLIQIPSFENFRRFCQYATPIFFTIFGKSVVYNGVAVSVGRLGSVALAAHQVLLRSFFFWTPVGDSVGMTSQVFLPGILAKERQTGVPQRGAKRLLFATGVLAGLSAAALAGLLPSKGAGLFTTDTAVATALTLAAPILALSVSMHAIALTCEGMLLAQRDLKFLSSSYVITTIATAAFLLSPFRPSSLGGSWWLLALFQGSRAIQFAFRNLWLSLKGSVKVDAHQS